MDKKIRIRKVVVAKAKPPLAGKAVAVASKAGALAPAAVAPAPKVPLKSPLNKAELDEFRKMLLEKRRSILGDMSGMEAQTLQSNRQDRSGDLSSIPIHPADVGTDNFEQEFTLGLLESERTLLREIDEAIERIDEGTYGVCLGTNKPIDKARLHARPWAKFCIEYARLMEKGLVPREDQPAKGEEDEAEAEGDADAEAEGETEAEPAEEEPFEGVPEE